MRKISRLFGLVLTCVALLGTNVFAATGTWSDTQYASVYGRNYAFDNNIYYNSASAWSFTSIDCEKTAPVGYLAGIARIYSIGGQLQKSSGWVYNSEPILGCSIAYTETTATGTLYASGKVGFYNGNGYTSYIVNKTPYIARDIPDYDINENGETYGKGIYSNVIGVEPDLMEAYGTDGTLGYVRTSEVDSCETFTGEIINSDGYTTTVPLYENDGQTVIGSFLVESSVASSF